MELAPNRDLQLSLNRKAILDPTDRTWVAKRSLFFRHLGLIRPAKKYCGAH
jgi:hypothetical protein